MSCILTHFLGVCLSFIALLLFRGLRMPRRELYSISAVIWPRQYTEPYLLAISYLIPPFLSNTSLNFTFSESCIMIHIRKEDQQDAHFFLIIYFSYIIFDMFRKIIVHHQEFCTSSLQYFTMRLIKSLVAYTMRSIVSCKRPDS
jgi:hypothetical protein